MEPPVTPEEQRWVDESATLASSTWQLYRDMLVGPEGTTPEEQTERFASAMAALVALVAQVLAVAEVDLGMFIVRVAPRYEELRRVVEEAREAEQGKAAEQR